MEIKRQGLQTTGLQKPLTQQLLLSLSIRTSEIAANTHISGYWLGITQLNCNYP